MMGLVTATGGGVARDVVLGRLPLVLEREDYLLWALLAAAAAIAISWAGRTIPNRLVAGADALGLGAFAVAGALAAIQADLSLPAVALLAILTATGGGVLRDLLVARVPLVLRSEVNATAAAAGGLTVWLLEPPSVALAGLAGLLVTAGIRLVSLALDLHLPTPRGRDTGEQGRLM
jgi:uncharacterized membrane protein YeiH